MRLWTLHPQLLDQKRLVAQWKEGITMLNIWNDILSHPGIVRTGAYYNHPQIKRLKFLNVDDKDILRYLHCYLYQIFIEATKRGYKFNINYLNNEYFSIPEKLVVVSKGQYIYEFCLMNYKNPSYLQIVKLKNNPIFIVDFDSDKIEPWEKTKEEVLNNPLKEKFKW